MNSLLDKLPPCWSIDPGSEGDASTGVGQYPAHIWVPAPNGDVVMLCILTPPLYQSEILLDEFDDGLRELIDPALVANAIVAVPDLLRAATAALHLCRSLLATREGATDELITEVYVALMDAVAKAEGGAI